MIASGYLTSGKRTTCRCSLRNGSLARRKDLTGQKFGKLTVIEMLYGYRRKKSGQSVTYCRCKCDCGNIVIRQAQKLKTSEMPSCGCAKKEIVRKTCGKNIDGQKFGRLTVLETLWNETPVKVRCKCDCGNEVVLAKSEVSSGGTRSCGCLQRERAVEANTKDFTGVVSPFGIKFIKPLYQNKKGVWVWQCQCHCGEYFEALPAHVLSKNVKVKSCGCMKSSSWEKLIEKCLKEACVNYKTQVSFNDCKDKGLLKFDFAIYDDTGGLKCLIEYDGQQHFKSIDWFGGQEAFRSRQRRDEIKNSYCKQNNIPLYRIPYTLTVDEVKTKITNIIYA